MGVTSLEISLNSPPYHVYRPGDVVTGSVKMSASADTDLSEGMTITLYGLAHVEWTERHGNSNSTYSGNEELFENSLLHSVSSDQTCYPFTMTIPNTPGLPWNTLSRHGYVEYGVKAVIKQPWFKLGNKKASMMLTINSHMNSRVSTVTMSEYCSAVITSNSDDSKAGFCCFPFCCWYLFSSEMIKLNLNIDSLWVYPGEDLNFTLDVDNTSTRRELGSPKVQLVGTWTHIAHCAVLFGTPMVRQKAYETVFHEEILPMRLTPGERYTQKGKFKVPLDLMPTQIECKVLKLTYKLRGVMDEISGFRCIKIPATVEVDVLIGTLGADETTTLNGNIY